MHANRQRQEQRQAQTKTQTQTQTHAMLYTIFAASGSVVVKVGVVFIQPVHTNYKSTYNVFAAGGSVVVNLVTHTLFRARALAQVRFQCGN